MERQISSLVLFAIVGGLMYYAWVFMTPYYFHDMTPNVPMQTVIGNKAWYFPMGYIEPHYPEGGYDRGGETEVWLTFSSSTGKILPQNIAERPIGETYDVILTSDRNSQTQKAMQELSALKKDMGTFALADNNLRETQIGNKTEYLDSNVSGDTRISCQGAQCTLFTTQIPDIRTAIVFNASRLPYWQKLIDNVALEIQPFRLKPTFGYYLASIASTHPAGVEDAPIVPDVNVLHGNDPLAIDPMPRMNHRGTPEPVPLRQP